MAEIVSEEALRFWAREHGWLFIAKDDKQELLFLLPNGSAVTYKQKRKRGSVDVTIGHCNRGR